jgi:hypothetical protein
LILPGIPLLKTFHYIIYISGALTFYNIRIIVEKKEEEKVLYKYFKEIPSQYASYMEVNS